MAAFLRVSTSLYRIVDIQVWNFVPSFHIPFYLNLEVPVQFNSIPFIFRVCDYAVFEHSF